MMVDPKKQLRSNKRARSQGARAENDLAEWLKGQGYEVRRTHLSAFPDLVVWNHERWCMIEVKWRSGGARSISGAVGDFRASVRQMSCLPPPGAMLSVYVLNNDLCHIYDWKGDQETGNTEFRESITLGQE